VTSRGRANEQFAWKSFRGDAFSCPFGRMKTASTDAYRNHLALIVETELPKEVREYFRTFTYV